MKHLSNGCIRWWAIFLVVLAVMLFDLVGCTTFSKLLKGSYNSDKPPVLTVTTSSGELVEVMQSTYNWINKGKAVNADCPAPLDMAAKITPTLLDRSAQEINGLLSFKFDYVPENVELFIWEKSGPRKYNFDHGKIIMPQEPGTYVFQMGGTWPQGSSSYVFNVEVK